MSVSQHNTTFDAAYRPQREPGDADRICYDLRLAEAGHYDGAPRVSPAASGAAAGALLIGLCTLFAALAPMLL